MSTRVLTVAIRIALLAALVASAVLFVEYRSGGATFCGADGGCAAVRQSAYSHPAGVPLPAVGMAVFALLLAGALAAVTRQQLRWLAMACTAVAIGALGLIALMLLEVKAVCGWCMVVDVSALGAAALGWGLAARAPCLEPRPLRGMWALVAAGAVAVPLLFGSAPGEATPPPGVLAEMQPSKVNIVTFTDFECPFCRQLHPVLDEIRATHPERIRVTRLMNPLRSHPGAEPAARGYLCAPADKRGALADKLYEAEHLDRQQVIAFARELGIDAAGFEACLSDAGTDRELARHRQLFEEAALRGLPSTYVDRQLVEGADVEALLVAVDRSLGARRVDVRWMLAALGLLIIAASVASLLMAGQGRKHPGLIS